MNYGSKEWFDGTIARQRAKLSRIVAHLFSEGRPRRGRRADTLPRYVWRSILRVLHPAESATRRLIASAARDIAVKLTIRQGKRKPLPQFRPAERDGAAEPAGTEELANKVDPSLDVPASVTATVILKDPSPRPMTNIRYKGKLVPVGQMPWLPQPEKCPWAGRQFQPVRSAAMRVPGAEAPRQPHRAAHHRAWRLVAISATAGA